MKVRGFQWTGWIKPIDQKAEMYSVITEPVIKIEIPRDVFDKLQSKRLRVVRYPMVNGAYLEIRYSHPPL